MRAIYIHAHVYPQECLKLFEKDGAKEGARLERTAGGYRLKTETLVNAFDERFVDLASRIEKMDEKRIGVHALSLTTPMVNWASPALGLALAQAYNDAASAAHGRHPERFVGLAILPMQDAQLALGVLDRFAKLEINLPHAGGAFPGLIGRLDHGTKVRPELKHMKRVPSEYLRRFTYDTIGHDDRINMNLIRLVGADRVTLGSDYCFDMGLEDPLAAVQRLQLSAKEKGLIAGGN